MLELIQLLIGISTNRYLRREHFGDAGGIEPLLGHPERRAQARPAGPNDHHIEFVVDDLVSGHAANPRRRF